MVCVCVCVYIFVVVLLIYILSVQHAMIQLISFPVDSHGLHGWLDKIVSHIK